MSSHPSPLEEVMSDVGKTIAQMSQIPQAFQESIAGAQRALEPLTEAIHERELNNLFEYYQTNIYSKIKDIKKSVKNHVVVQPCCQVCESIPYSFPISAIVKNPTEVDFAKRLIQLDYRVCRHCKRIIPFSEIKKLRTKYSPKYCPCCNTRMILTEGLIRRTVMRQYMYAGEGY